MAADDIPILFCGESINVPRFWHRCRYHDGGVSSRNRDKCRVSAIFRITQFWLNILNLDEVQTQSNVHVFLLFSSFKNRMALILHGEGLCCFKNVHHHHHSCHSHSPKHETYHNNNRTKFEYRPLLNEPAAEKRGANKLWNSIPSSFVRSKQQRPTVERRDSVCSTRSPNSSRSNSIGRYTNGHTSGSDMIRRSSHTTTTLSTSISVKIKDMQDNDCIDIELNDEKLPINCAEETIGARGCVSNGSAICPIHHYVHRDSSEHTPIMSSDSEDLHEHHQHRHSLVNQLHSNHSRHSHDFSSKNINIQAAVIHVIGDFIQSIGVFIAAIIIKNYVSWFKVWLHFLVRHTTAQYGGIVRGGFFHFNSIFVCGWRFCIILA